MRLEDIARVCYEANKAYADTLGEQSVPFEVAVDSMIKGIESLIKEPGTTPEQLHESWLANKIKEGWHYGPVKDVEKKTHPQMVPYANLPEEQRIKDYLFQGIVRVLARLPKGYVHV